jgi:hypothetical protein
LNWKRTPIPQFNQFPQFNKKKQPEAKRGGNTSDHFPGTIKQGASGFSCLSANKGFHSLFSKARLVAIALEKSAGSLFDECLHRI